MKLTAGRSHQRHVLCGWLDTRRIMSNLICLCPPLGSISLCSALAATACRTLR